MRRPDREFDAEFYRRSVWELKFCWWPTRCDRSLRKIWLKWAYEGTWMICGPGEPITMTRWLTKEEFIIYRLRGNYGT